MTLKECVTAAAESVGITLADGFSSYDFSACAHDKAVAFISDADSAVLEEWQSIDGEKQRSAKHHVKLTVFGAPGKGVSQADSALEAVKRIFEHLSFDGGFMAVQLSVSEAKASAAHSRVKREAYISAVMLCSISEEVKPS